MAVNERIVIARELVRIAKQLFGYSALDIEKKDINHASKGVMNALDLLGVALADYSFKAQRILERVPQERKIKDLVNKVGLFEAELGSSRGPAGVVDALTKEVERLRD